MYQLVYLTLTSKTYFLLGISSVHKILYQDHKQPQFIRPAVGQQTGLDNLLRYTPTLVILCQFIHVIGFAVLVHSTLTSLKSRYHPNYLMT